MNALIFRSLDSLFFRDGRPYHQGETQADVVSQFPPFSPTLIGAARAAYARSLGWTGKGAWSESIMAALGDGPDLGPLDFCGPYLLQDGDPDGDSTTSASLSPRERVGVRGAIPVFPVPLLLLKTKAGGYVRLSPGPERQCDLGEPGEKVRLPEPAENTEGAKEAKGWITVKGLDAVLEGGVPEAEAKAILSDDALFQREPRIGHVRNGETRIIDDDHALYSPAHIRLQLKVTLALNVTGLPADLQPANPTPLGGESRLAWIERRDEPIALPKVPQLEATGGKVCYSVILLTPLDIGEIGAPQPNQSYAGLPGKLVTACLGRIQRVGGWENRNADGKGEPLALRPLLPAGSVLFMEAEAKDGDSIRELHGRKIGARTAWGFGQIVIGTWEN